MLEQYVRRDIVALKARVQSEYPNSCGHCGGRGGSYYRRKDNDLRCLHACAHCVGRGLDPLDVRIALASPFNNLDEDLSWVEELEDKTEWYLFCHSPTLGQPIEFGEWGDAHEHANLTLLLSQYNNTLKLIMESL
jgi:hypothetical protein